MEDRFHRAARDGYLDLLREATKRDSNKQDEDGMTPTLWAAFAGNADALRLLVRRGGDPDKCDFIGNTALHCAAVNGNSICVEYLVNFGANIWALDNDFHTPMDLAAQREHMSIVKYLDAIVAKQTSLNKKVVRKLREKAVLDAKKRIKEYQKMQLKASKKADRADKKIAKMRDKMEPTYPKDPPNGIYSNGLERENASSMTISLKTVKASHNQNLHYSEYFKQRNSGGVAKRINKKKCETNGDFKILENREEGKKSMRSLKGLQRDPDILFVNTETGLSRGKLEDIFDSKSLASKAISEPDFHHNGDDSGIDSYDSQPQESHSLFERPGFGSVAFFNRFSTGAMMSLPHRPDEDIDGITSPLPSLERPETQNGGRLHRRGSTGNDSIGTLGSLAVRAKNSGLPWKEDDVESLDDEAENEGTKIELFLASCALTEFISVFTKEKIDMEALELCSDSDLKDIGIPLGPRRKIIDAIEKRKSLLECPGVIQETYL